MSTSTSITDQNNIHAVLTKWIEAIEGRELGMLPEVVAMDTNLIWIGTAVNEWVSGYRQLEQVMQAQNDALLDIQIDVSEESIHTYPQVNLAWATNRWVYHARAGEEELVLPLRCTWILEKRAQGWRIVHFHKSVGMPV